MALSESAVSEVLDAFRAGEGVDLIRESVRLVLQELIELEAAEVIGASRYERCEERTTERNGHRPRLVATQAGDIELGIPKLRKGSFFPAILERRRRIDRALYAVVMEAYVSGVSTRSVDDLVAALGIGSGISKSEVSRICAQLDDAVGAFRTRDLDHLEFPYVYLDATYLHVRDDHQVTSKAVVVATGITATGTREILGVDVGDSEDEAFWRQFLRSLKNRGLAGVRLVISDQHAGLTAAIRRCFQGAAHQRCRVHFARNLLALIPKAHQDMVAACSAPSSLASTPRRSPPSGTTSEPPSPNAGPKQPNSWTPPKSRSSPSQPSPSSTGRRSGPRTPSNGSTRRSSAAAASWASSPTKPR